MIDVLFYTDTKKGHTIPTFAIADSLIKQGTRIAYFGIEEAMDFVKLNGFETHTIFEDEFPATQKQKKHSGQSPVTLILKGKLDQLVSDLKPKVIVSTAHDPLGMLVLYYKYKLKTFIVWSYFPRGNYLDPKHCPYQEGMKRGVMDVIYNHPDPKALSSFIDFVENSGVKVNKLEDIAKPIEDFNHFITCSKELFMENIPFRKKELYLGSCIFEKVKFSAAEDSKALIDEFKNEKYIYCSLGSWAHEINKTRAIGIFKLVISAMKDKQLQKYKLLMATGKLIDDVKELDIPDNVLIYSWLPQLSLLENAELAILHAGTGAMKECIFHKVPMIVAPVGVDQFDNAEMVLNRNIGKMIGEKQDAKELVALILDTIQSLEIKESLNEMDLISKKDSKRMNTQNVVEEW